MAPDKPLLIFPCRFPIKVLGYESDTFASTIVDIVKRFAPEITAHDVSTRLSKDSKYLAVSITILAQSQEQLDNIYLALNACPDVVMCL